MMPNYSKQHHSASRSLFAPFEVPRSVSVTGPIYHKHVNRNQDVFPDARSSLRSLGIDFAAEQRRIDEEAHIQNKLAKVQLLMGQSILQPTAATYTSSRQIMDKLKQQQVPGASSNNE